VKEKWNKKLSYTVAFCWSFLSYDARIHERQASLKPYMQSSVLVLCNSLSPVLSGFGGLVVSVLASGTQDRGFTPSRSSRIFRAKNPQHSFLRRGSKTACPMSQICGILKTPGNYVEIGFSGEICRPFLVHFTDKECR
jgi:hypothetical protein